MYENKLGLRSLMIIEEPILNPTVQQFWITQKIKS